MEPDYKRYTDLAVWIAARKLVTDIYKTSANFLSAEIYGLTNQIRRCVVSIPSNIAERCGKNFPKDSLQFFFIARGSLYELETQLFLSFDLNYFDEQTKSNLFVELENVRKLLSGFIKYY